MNVLSRLHGLTVAAPFPLGPTIPQPATVDWTVLVGAELAPGVHDDEPSDPIVARIDGPPSFYLLIQHSDVCFTFRFHQFADAFIDMTRRQVTWHALPHADRARIPALMSGTVMAAVCQLGGNLVLHASAVEIRGSGIAFVGDSGAGKSTVAALACLGGARLVTDDVLRVETSCGTIRCYRGARVLRLRSGSSALATSVPGSSMSPDGRHLMSPMLSELDSLPLRLLLLPRVSDSVNNLALRPLAEQEAALSLLASPRVRGWRHTTAASLFHQLMDLPGSMPTWELALPADFHASSSAPKQLNDLLSSAL